MINMGILGTEKLREALLDADRARNKENRIRTESELLLAALKILTSQKSNIEIFASILDVMQKLINFEFAFILTKNGDEMFRVVAANCARFNQIVWPLGDLLSLVTQKHPVVLFDVSYVKEWRELPMSVRIDVTSALHVTLQTQAKNAIFVCTHHERGFFNNSHAKRALRFAPLAAQAFKNIHYTSELEITNQRLQEEINFRRKVEEKLRVSHEQMISSAKMATLGTIAGEIAHEINTPLAVIKLRSRHLSKIFAQPTPDLKSGSKFLNAIETTVDQIVKIVSSLKNLSRSADDDPMTVVMLSSVVDGAFLLCNHLLEQNGVKITIESAPEIQIKCQPVQLSQILINLISNACDAVAHSEEKFVQLWFTNSPERIGIHVTDSGSGIDKKTANKIFQPFFTTKPHGSGTGLGLSISRGIAESHGGELIFDPAAKNTTFILFLPKIRDHAPEVG